MLCHVFKAYGVPWQMLLPYCVGDFIILYVVDGITTEADGITSC